MAYSLNYTFGLGSANTGLTLRAQILNTSGSNTGSEITTGIVEIGNGWYYARVTTIPDDHEGSIKFYESGSPSTPLIAFSVDPKEGEYLDQQLTTLLTTAMVEDYAADGSPVSVLQALYEILQFHNEREIASTTMTVKKRDGSTTAYTLTLNDATSPTSISRSG